MSNMSKPKPTDIDGYLRNSRPEVRGILTQMRTTIQRAAPGAQEAIRCGVPTFIQGGVLVYFASFRNQIGFYPMPSAIEEFKEHLSLYKSGKGSVQFPLNRPLPFDLIEQIVQFRVKEVCGQFSCERKK